jgi:hypothetical protein
VVEKTAVAGEQGQRLKPSCISAIDGPTVAAATGPWYKTIYFYNQFQPQRLKAYFGGSSSPD